MLEVETTQKRLHSDITHDVSEQNAAIVKVVETMIAAKLTTIQMDVDEIKTDMASIRGTNDRQLELLEEAATERGRRKEREEEIDRRQKAEERAIHLRKQELVLRGESVKIDGAVVKIEGEAADVRIQEMEARARVWKVRAAIFIPIVTLIAGLIGKAAGSH